MKGWRRKIASYFGKEILMEQEQRFKDLEEKYNILKENQDGLTEYIDTRKIINPNIEENIRNNNARLNQIEQRFIEFIKDRENDYSCIDYFDFENHFRGSREVIKTIQEQYLKYFKGRNHVLDIGCGRGEFLELLKEHDIDAVGIDTYAPFVEYCTSLDLNVIKEDGLEYLRQQEKVGGVFVGQVIEHLRFKEIYELCMMAYERLEDGAYIVMETPNPMSVSIYTHAFYMDPSHNKPIHPLTMEYLMRKIGFQDIQILFTETSQYPVKIPELVADDIENIENFNEAMKEVSHTLFGSQDYAIIGRR